MLSDVGIDWEVNFGERKGQVLNHQKTLEKATTEWIWRCDDDNVPSPDVLEKLLSVATDEVGAVAGLVLEPSQYNNWKPNFVTNNICDIYNGYNIQWFRHNGISEVDHLYSSFIYRRVAGEHGYCMELSPVGHREETIFTYEMKRNGWKLLVNPNAVTWHFRFKDGGIRSYNQHSLWENDEQYFTNKMQEWNVNIDKKIIVLNNGLGDHFAFRHVLPELIDKYGKDNLIISACYPEVFKNDGIKLISIGEAIMMFGEDKIDNYNVYKFMWDNNWKKSIVEAFREMLL
jgi:hypothetical protein